MQTQAFVVLEATQKFSLENIELDDLHDDEVLVEMVATGICHTDLKSANGGSIVKFPVVLGHEGIPPEWQLADCRGGSGEESWTEGEKGGGGG